MYVRPILNKVIFIDYKQTLHDLGRDILLGMISLLCDRVLRDTFM
jgi:hypothetical protein